MSSPKRALITGITGQDGSYLAELLLEKGYEVHGMVRRVLAPRSSSASSTSATASRCTRATCSTSARSSTRCAQSQPDEVYNLAALSFVAASLEPADADRRVHRRRRHAHARGDPRGRAPRRASTRRRAREMFGKVREVPQNEATPFYPRSPYGVAKVYGHFITVNYRECYDLHALLGHPVQPRVAAPRPGVRHAQDHVARGGDQARAARRAARSATSTPKRDWGFAGDYVEAMWLMLQQDDAGRLRRSRTGETHTVRECVEIAFDAGRAGLGELRRDRPAVRAPGRGRPADRRPDEGRSASSAGSRESSFEELVRLMARADLELLAR